MMFGDVLVFAYFSLLKVLKGRNFKNKLAVCNTAAYLEGRC